MRRKKSKKKTVMEININKKEEKEDPENKATIQYQVLAWNTVRKLSCIAFYIVHIMQCIAHYHMRKIKIHTSTI